MQKYWFHTIWGPNHDVVILSEGHAGLVRDMNIPFKPRHGEAKLTKEEIAKKRKREKDREANGRPLHVPEGQMMQHVRLQRKRFMGMAERKHTCGHAYQLRLAKARQKLIKESVPKIKPSVLIKPKDGRRSYIRDDARLTEALRSINHTKRAQDPHDNNINPVFNAWVKKFVEEIKLVQIDSEESEVEIDNEPTPTPSKKVTLSNFLVRPGLLGNQSGDESDFEENGTMLLVKEEEKSEDSEAEGGYCHPDDRTAPKSLHQQRPETCTTSTQVEASDTAADTGMGTSDSSSEDDEPPNEEAAKTARKLVVFNATQQLVEDPGTATALLQALAKFRFQFKTAKGIKKTCGEDFFNLDIPKDAKVKSFRAKKKGTGKKLAPGHISAQERDPDVLVLEITNEESEMLKEPDNTTAGPSGKRGRSKEKEKVEAPQKSDGGKKRKRKNSPRYRWIKFYHEENTQAAKEAKEDRTSHQLLVHGLPKASLGPTQAGSQEKTLNDLMAGLSKETLGEDGVNIVQDNIIGAQQIEPSPGEKSPITRITLDSRDTKASIRRAAEKADRWGNGTHSVFFRDITLDKRKRKSSNEDLNMPKKGKYEDTPRRGGGGFKRETPGTVWIKIQRGRKVQDGLATAKRT